MLLAEWDGAGQRLQARQESLSSLELVMKAQRAQLENEQRTQRSMLRSIREERSAHEAMLKELKAGAARLQGLLASFDRKTEDPADDEAGDEPEGEFAGLRGGLCYPAPGPVTVGFGRQVHPEFNTVTMHNGIEIGAAKGTTVKSVAPGVVRFAEWFRGYGNLVIVDHGEGYYTIYAHLSRIGVSVGQQVNKGGPVGNVGDTGSLHGASLYFEIRRHQKPLNPISWLANCAL
jgi:septal ring factor EnvC (AmiA/AmiB activator)